MQSDFSDNCLHRYNIENLNLFYTELELVNTKQMIKNKLKELIIELKKYKVQAILVSAYKMKHLKTHASKHYNKNEKLCLRRLDCLKCNNKA